LLTIAAVGIALVILTGVGYTNLINTKTQLYSQLTCTGATGSPCSVVVGNANVVNAIGYGTYVNASTYGGAITNTTGSNSNYVYYILFMALVIAVVVGALVTAVKRKQG